MTTKPMNIITVSQIQTGTARQRKTRQLASLQCWARSRAEISQEDTDQLCEEDSKHAKLDKNSHSFERRGEDIAYLLSWLILTIYGNCWLQGFRREHSFFVLDFHVVGFEQQNLSRLSTKYSNNITIELIHNQWCLMIVWKFISSTASLWTRFWEPRPLIGQSAYTDDTFCQGRKKGSPEKSV
jgi:hypothetical protein